YRFAASKDLSSAENHHLFDCIECGCCTHVCPSNISLVDYYRQAKTEIRASQQSQAKAQIARQRYEFRLERLEREKEKQAQRQAEKKAALSQSDNTDKQALIKAALARAKKKKAE
ncbi:MAG: electron transport complex subunit RsxC, partial [Pseudomonadota bacterium]